MSNLDKLKRFMYPLYQEIADEVILEEYLVEYIYPECAAAAMWEEESGRYALQGKGIVEFVTGAEKFKYASPDTLAFVATNAAKMYRGRCNDIQGNGSCAVKVSRETVAGIEGPNL